MYTHRRMLDVCMLVINVAESLDGSTLKVRWFKRNGLDLGALDSVYIQGVDYPAWYEVEDGNS